MADWFSLSLAASHPPTAPLTWYTSMHPSSRPTTTSPLPLPSPMGKGQARVGREEGRRGAQYSAVTGEEEELLPLLLEEALRHSFWEAKDQRRMSLGVEDPDPPPIPTPPSSLKHPTTPVEVP